MIQVKDQLTQKFINAVKSGNMKSGTVYDENTPEYEDKPSIITRFIEKGNERARQKMLAKRGEQ